MFTPRRFWLLIVTGFSFCIGPAVAEEKSGSPVFSADRRLDRSVTIKRRRVYLGELIDKLAAETGVRLRVSDEQGPVSGYELSVFVRERKASEVLAALANLYDAPPDRWSWSRDGKNEPPDYVLKHTLHPDSIRLARETEARRALQEQYELLNRFFATPEAQRPALLQRHPLLEGFDNPQTQAAFAMLQSVPPDQRQGLLAGGRAAIPLTQLPPSARAFAADYFQRSRSTEPPPSRVEFSFDTMFGPSIVFQLGGAGGGAVLGGATLERSMRSRDLRLWTPDLAGVPNRMVPPSAASGVPGRKAPPAVLDQLVQAASIDLLFDHARGVNSTHNYREPLTGDLRKVLQEFDRTGLICKWRGQFALFRERIWPSARRAAAVPWPMRKELRKAAAANDGFLGLEEWLKLSGMGAEQLETLGEEFPDAGRIKQMQIPLRVVASMNRAERLKVSRPEGAGWGDWSPATRKRLLTLFTPADAPRVRVLLRLEKGEGTPQMAVYFGEADGDVRPRLLSLQRRVAPREE